MTLNEFYPHGLYRFLLTNLQANNKLAIKEVAITFIRKQAEELGFKCDHTNVGFSKKNRWSLLQRLLGKVGTNKFTSIQRE